MARNLYRLAVRVRWWWPVLACALSILLVLLAIGAHNIRRSAPPEKTPTPTPSFLLAQTEQCGNLLISPPWQCVGGAAFSQYGNAEGIAWGAGYPLVVPGERYAGNSFYSRDDCFCQGGEWGGFCVRGGDVAAREYLATRVTIGPPSPSPEQ